MHVCASPIVWKPSTTGSPLASVKRRSRLSRPPIGRTPPTGSSGPSRKNWSGPGRIRQACSKPSGSMSAARRSPSSGRIASVIDSVSPSPGTPRYFTKPRLPPSFGSSASAPCRGSRYQRVRYIRPLSWIVSSTVTPCSASHAGTGLRRPIAATTTRAGTVVPSASVTPSTTGVPPVAGTTVRPVTVASVRIVTRGSASAALRSTHSNVVRRTTSTARSSSPGCGSPSAAVVFNVWPPAAMSASSTSGRCSRSSTTTRARNPCVWWACGAPTRSETNASSGSASAGSGSRSSSSTW